MGNREDFAAAFVTSPRIYFEDLAADGYKYRLRRDYSIELPHDLPGLDIAEDLANTPWLQLTAEGVLTARAGYAWDGPSGPTLDTPNSMRGGLVHDALYQAIRLGWLTDPRARESADRLFYRILREDGMGWLRARAWFRAVRLGGGPATRGRKYEAPRERVAP